MPAENWRSVSLPKTMVDTIKRIVEAYPDMGFRSVAHFIEYTVRTSEEYRLVVLGEPLRGPPPEPKHPRF